MIIIRQLVVKKKGVLMYKNSFNQQPRHNTYKVLKMTMKTYLGFTVLVTLFGLFWAQGTEHFSTDKVRIHQPIILIHNQILTVINIIITDNNSSFEKLQSISKYSNWSQLKKSNFRQFVHNLLMKWLTTAPTLRIHQLVWCVFTKCIINWKKIIYLNNYDFWSQKHCYRPNLSRSRRSSTSKVSMWDINFSNFTSLIIIIIFIQVL